MQQQLLTKSGKPRKNRQLKKKCLRRGPKITTGTGARRKREAFSSRYPKHVVLRLREGLPSLRTKQGARLVKECILGARNKGVRVIHFAILSNHIHLYVEGKNLKTLQSGMRSFCTLMALGLRSWIDSRRLKSKEISRLGLFRGRYHFEVLKTPKQVRNALKYILSNPCKHFRKALYLDKFTSQAAFKYSRLLWGRSFKGVNTSSPFVKNLKEELESFLDPPKLWLSTEGWKLA